LPDGLRYSEQLYDLRKKRHALLFECGGGRFCCWS
jgi:hypothetical protein